MTTMSADGRVIVGVDGSSGSLAAAQFGVDLAARRQVPVLVLNAYQPPRPDLPVTPRIAEAYRMGGLDVVHRVLAHVRVPARLAVQTDAVPGPLAEVLLNRSAAAGLVAIGTHHLVLDERGLPGGTGSAIGKSIGCPLAVVPTRLPIVETARAPVVVALDGETAATAVLRFAFDEAAARGVRLLVLHADTDRIPGSERRGATLDLEEIVAGWKADYPDLVVTVLVLPGETDVVLTEASDHAQLLVVGGPHRRRFGGWTRSVAHAVLNRSRCPLVMVPQPRAAQPSGRLSAAAVAG